MEADERAKKEFEEKLKKDAEDRQKKEDVAKRAPITEAGTNQQKPNGSLSGHAKLGSQKNLHPSNPDQMLRDVEEAKKFAES